MKLLIGVWIIGISGDPGDKVIIYFGIVNRENPISGSQLSASRDSENRES
jgi:hypothetical protein